MTDETKFPPEVLEQFRREQEEDHGKCGLHRVAHPFAPDFTASGDRVFAGPGGYLRAQ